MSRLNGVRIVSDGTTQGTHVYDSKGMEILGLRSVTWSIEVGKAGVATLVYPLVEITALGDSHEKWSPLSLVQKNDE